MVVVVEKVKREARANFSSLRSINLILAALVLPYLRVAEAMERGDSQGREERTRKGGDGGQGGAEESWMKNYKSTETTKYKAQNSVREVIKKDEDEQKTKEEEEKEKE